MTKIYPIQVGIRKWNVANQSLTMILIVRHITSNI